MKVAEIFLSVQGEGNCAGRRAVFLRLAGCNLSCKFCDTAYAQIGGKEFTISQVLQTIKKYKLKDESNQTYLVITGGEPLLQQEELIPLLKKLNKTLDWFIEVETNGTIEPSPDFMREIDRFNVSPKLTNALDKPLKLAKFFLSRDYLSSFKFVIGSLEDLKEMEQFILKNHLKKTYHTNFYLMPESTTVEQHNRILPLLFDYVKSNPEFIITPRLHILAYGNIKGV